MTNKIVLVDDHKLVCAGFEKLISSFPDYEVIYTVSNGKELLERFQNPISIPDLVLLDISMPIMDGFQTMKELHKHHPDIRVLALSTDDSEETYMKMMELGANGFLSKMIDEKILKTALSSIFSKGYFYSEEVTDSLFKSIRAKKLEPEVLISNKEKELMSYIGTDLTYQQIAAKMFVSPKSVDSYRNSLFRKLDVKSRTALAMYAVKKGFFIIE